jgi:hypothetical protein
MTILWPITTPTEGAQQLIEPGSRDDVVTVTDLANEFGDTFDLDQDALDLATTKVEEHLRRPLRRAVYKERLRIIYDGFNDARVVSHRARTGADHH